MNPEHFPAVTSDLLARHDRPGPRYTSYPTALEFSETYGQHDHRRTLERFGSTSDPISMYVHLPFCESRCSFCACHVVITSNASLTDRYLEAVQTEAATVAELIGSGRGIVQYHWGGGTPTYHHPEQLEALHRSVLEHFELTPNAELAVEVDPRVTTRAHLQLLASLGFNRLSAGVQDVDDRVQELIGRHQTHHQTETLVAEARDLGFRSINLDLIYGLPGQTRASFRRTLEAVLELRPDRLAAYSFAYVPWVKPHQRRIDPDILPNRETKFELLALLVTTLTEAGYVHIGMDHFALATDELAVVAAKGQLSRNFMGYTTIHDTGVIALGSSGISQIDGIHAQNHRQLSSYLETAGFGMLATERGMVPSADDRIRRHVITGLMCNGSIDFEEVSARFGVNATSYFAPELAALMESGGLVDEGLAAIEGTMLRATELGRLFLRRLAMAFDAYLDQSDRRQPRFSRTI